MAKSWTIRHSAGRPSSWALIADRNPLFTNQYFAAWVAKNGPKLSRKEGPINCRRAVYDILMIMAKLRPIYQLARRPPLYPLIADAIHYLWNHFHAAVGADGNRPELRRP